MAVYDLPASYLDTHRSELKRMLNDNSRFGNGAGFEKPLEDEIFYRKEFSEIKVVRELKDRAWKQIGSSGSGNHFVEFGTVEIMDAENELKLAPGSYLAVLSHSGSRGLGASIAGHYTKIAKEVCRLPGEAQYLAWLDMNTEAGQEYWLAMNLAGDYASACHHHIHRRMAKSLGETPLAMIENHHNFAWKEKLADGKEVIVHRKGATPASKGTLGIIPGSMTHEGFIVRGKGEPDSLNSAAHGAGRRMSRTKAKEAISRKEMDQYLQKHGVELIGGGLDEAPMAYKDIREVMAFQQDLVEIVGVFKPKIVRMDS
jgi:tRNA-splicing ligase RtcB